MLKKINDQKILEKKFRNFLLIYRAFKRNKKNILDPTKFF